jgi:hypothetical protein
MADPTPIDLLRSTRANARHAGPHKLRLTFPEPIPSPSHMVSGHMVSAHMVSGDGPATGVAAAMISSMRAITT